MPSGLQVWDAAGTLVFDTTTAGVGCVADTVASATTSFVKDYPAFAGRTTLALSLQGVTVASISYASGYPSITFPATISPGDERWLVIML